MTLFVEPRMSPSSGGSNYESAEYYFYLSGTTTPATAYSDADLTTAHASPVVADSDGVFPAIWLDPLLTYRRVLKSSAGATISDIDPYPGSSIPVNQANIGATLWPQTDAELAASITPSRYNYPPGNLKRYTTSDGDGSDISGAFGQMLGCGEKLCFVPAPDSSWGIATQITWVSGVSVSCGRGTSFTSTMASGEWAFVFDGVPYGAGAVFKGFILNIANTGARGIQLWESRNCYLDEFEIRGPAGIGGYGIEINGGDDASGTYGSAHNVIGHNVMVYQMAAGVRLYTDNTTTPASNTAFANRNFVGRVQANACTEGLSIDRANTNFIQMSLQANTEGADIGQYAKNNGFDLQLENNTRQVVLHISADENLFAGNVQPTDFVDSGGSAVDPHFSVAAVGSQLFQLPRDVTMPSNGGIRLMNPYDTGPMRVRAGDTYDQDLLFGSHDSADTNFDLLALRYDASAPYAELVAAMTLRLGAASRIRWSSTDSQTTVGAAGGASALPATPTGYIKINVNGTDRVIPYYAIS